MRTVTSPWMFSSLAISGYSGDTLLMKSASVASTGPDGVGGAVAGGAVDAADGIAVGTPFALPTGGGVYACSAGPPPLLLLWLCTTCSFRFTGGGGFGGGLMSVWTVTFCGGGVACCWKCGMTLSPHDPIAKWMSVETTMNM